MQHIKLKGNYSKIIQAKSYEGLLTIMCIWNDGRQVTSSKNDKTHPAKSEQEKKTPLSKKDKKFKKNKEEKTGGFLVMHISLASKKYLHPQHRHYQLNHHSVSLKEDLGSRMEKMEQRENTRANKPSKSASKTQRTRNKILGLKNVIKCKKAYLTNKKRKKIRKEDLS